MSKRLVSFFFLPVLLLTACATGPRHTNWSSATGAEEFERLLWKDIQQKNWKSVEQHFSATYTSLSPDGATRDRAGEIEYLKKLDLKEYSLGEFQVQPNGPDLLVTYLASLRGSMDGRPITPSRLRMMTIWQQVGRHWVAIAHASAPSQP